MESSVSLVLTGDVMLGRLVDRAIQSHGPSYPWGNTLPLLRAADAAVINLECVIARSGRPWARWPKVFHFRADPQAITTLQSAGVDCAVLANNHVLDYEEEAFLEMLDLLRENGIAYAGAGRTLEEARQPALLTAGNRRIGVVAFTDNEPGWAATPERPGTNGIPISLTETSLGPVRESIARARAAGADLVLFSIHWGPNMRSRPSAQFRQFAHAVIEAGADIYHGHSAHVFQGIEVYRGRPILYDAGDFVDDYAVDPCLRNDWGLLFRLPIAPAGVTQIELIPVLIADCQVNTAVGSVQEAIAERICALSAEMGTSLRREGERLWVECAPPLP